MCNHFKILLRSRDHILESGWCISIFVFVILATVNWAHQVVHTVKIFRSVAHFDQCCPLLWDIETKIKRIKTITKTNTKYFSFFFDFCSRNRNLLFFVKFLQMKNKYEWWRRLYVRRVFGQMFARRCETGFETRK